MLNKLNNKIKNYNILFDKYKNLFINYPKLINFKKNTNINENDLIRKEYRLSIKISSFISYINNIKYILVISTNLYFILPLLHYFKTKIILILINCSFNVDVFYIKKNYNIDIYYSGPTYNYDTYCIIKKILKNKIFSTIIIDCGRDYTEMYLLNVLIISLLIVDEYLTNDGCYIDYNTSLNIIKNNIFFKLLNIMYNNFYNHNFNEIHLNFHEFINNLLIYTNVKNRLQTDLKTNLINILKNINYEDNYNKIINDEIENKLIKFKLTNTFIKNTYIRWCRQYIEIKETINRLENVLLNINNQKRIIYHSKQRINNVKINYINIISYIESLPNYDDINNIFKHNTNNILCFNKIVFENTYKSYNKNKNLLLLYIKILTNYDDINIIIFYTNLKNKFLPLLINLFPKIKWYINKNDKFVYTNKQIIFYENIKEIKIKDDTNKILYISNYYDKTKSKMKNMIEQSIIGINLKADYLLLNIYLLYDNDRFNNDYSKKYSDLNYNNINNKELSTLYNFLYLKGDILLDLYSSSYDFKLNLFVKKNNNLYDLEIYDFVDLKNKILKYYSEIQNKYYNIPTNYIELIPGFDNSYSCLIEYKIIYNYYNKFYNISDEKIIINNIFNLNFLLEELTNKPFILSRKYDILHKLKKKYITKDNKEMNTLNFLKKITSLNISNSAKQQKSNIINNGHLVFTEEKIKKSIEYLDKFIINKKYYKFKLI